MSTNQNKTNQNIKKNIRALREANGLTMKSVAEALGIKPNTYRIWEDLDKTGPKAWQLVEIAKIYNVSVDFLMRSRADNEKSANKVSSTEADKIYGDKYLNELTPAEKTTVMKMRRMSSADRNKVNDLIEKIIEDTQ